MGHIFISYSRKDTSIVNRLIGELKNSGYTFWIDREGIRGGELWRRSIVEAIENADKFLIVLSSNSVESENVRKELDIASEAKKAILPIAIHQTTIPKDMRYQLAGLQRVDITGDFEAGIRQLLTALGREDIKAPYSKSYTPEANKPVKPKSRWIDVSGEWQGTVTSDSGKILYRWLLTQNENSVTGTIRISTMDDSSYALYSIEGIVTGDELYFEGREFLEKTPNSGWCMATGTLKYDSSDGIVTLRGYWGSNPIRGGCPPGSEGSINLQKK